MKPFFRNTLFAAGILACAQPACAAVAFSPGDLGIFFYSYNPTSGAIGQTTYVVNLGQASLYRENTRLGVSVSEVNPAVPSNINADLTAAFGEDWENSGTVLWGVAGGVSPSEPLTVGDPSRTSYLSRSRDQLAAGASGPGTTISSISSTNRGNLATNIDSLRAGTNAGINHLNSSTSTPGSNPAGVLLPTSNINSPEDFFPPATLGLFFGQGVDPRQRLLTGPIAGGTNVEGALDIYRILHSATDADLSAGLSSGNAVIGQGQFIGTLTLDAEGNLKIGAGGGAPAQNFTSWAASNGVTGGPEGDSDNDGVKNLLEYALALNPAGSDASVGSFTGGLLSFSKRSEAVTNGDVNYAIEESDDLGITDPWAIAAGVADTSSVISYTLPAGKPKTFARLKVTQK